MLTITSFGYKHGQPSANVLIDVRFLWNPYWTEFRHLRGTDKLVQNGVLSNSTCGVEKIEQVLDACLNLIALYGGAHRSPIVIAFGCTGGHHRSVAMAEMLSKRLKDKGIEHRVIHRDVSK